MAAAFEYFGVIEVPAFRVAYVAEECARGDGQGALCLDRHRRAVRRGAL